MEILAPRSQHEEYKRFIERIIDALADELDLSAEPRGSTTWKRKRDAKGAEPDTCYYIRSAERIVGKGNIDINEDPPPDLVVEIDATSESVHKFPIYAAFRIPEIWRYQVKRNLVEMYELRGAQYIEIASSLTFEMLTPSVLSDFIAQSKTRGQKSRPRRVPLLMRPIRGQLGKTNRIIADLSDFVDEG